MILIKLKIELSTNRWRDWSEFQLYFLYTSNGLQNYSEFSANQDKMLLGHILTKFAPNVGHNVYKYDKWYW